MNRNLGATVVACVFVAVVLVLGFGFLGSPKTQRLVQSDVRAIQALAQLAQQINSLWQSSGNTLPAGLDKIPDTQKQHPITHAAFVYHPKSNNEYELCATFATDNRDQEDKDSRWIHPKGAYCFQLNASQQVPQVPYSYY